MDLKSPFNLKDRANSVAHLLDNRRQHVLSRARRRIWRMQQAVSERSLDTQLQALGALDQWTEPLEDKGVASKIAKAVDTQLASVLAPRIEAYDERTAKDLVSLIRDIEEPARLRRIGRYEAAHKARKTVLGAVEKQLGRLEPKVVELEKWELAAGEEPAVA